MEIHVFKKEEVKDAFRLISRLSREKYGLDSYPKIIRNELGKPFFPSLDHVHFSISHSKCIWALAIDDKPVGLDIEIGRNVERNWSRLAERFFTSDEQNYVEKHGEKGFFRVWVRKEAGLKLTGQGLSGGLQSFTVVKNMKLTKKVPMGYLTGFSLGEGFYGACCSPRNVLKKDLIINDHRYR